MDYLFGNFPVALGHQAFHPEKIKKPPDKADINITECPQKEIFKRSVQIKIMRAEENPENLSGRKGLFFYWQGLYHILLLLFS